MLLLPYNLAVASVGSKEKAMCSLRGLSEIVSATYSYDLLWLLGLFVPIDILQIHTTLEVIHTTFSYMSFSCAQ